MTTTFHDAWVNNVTYYEATKMNVPLGQLDARIVELSVGIYDIGGIFENVPTSSEVILRFPVPRDIAFVSNMGASQIVAGMPATAESIFSIKKNGAEFATATFAASETSGAFLGSSESFVAGDILTIVCPSSPDATLANIGWCLVASRIVLVP